MKKLLHVLFVLVLLIGLNVSEGNTASAVQAKQVLRIGFDYIPVDLDPATSTDSSTTTVIKGIFEGLVRLNDAGEAVPGIAKSWTVSKDGKTYTFSLRPSAKWSNQQQVKASDFEYAWKQALAPQSMNSYAFKMFIIANAENYHKGKLKESSKVGVKALNNDTLQVTLNEKTSHFPQLLAESIYMPINAQVAKADKNWAYNIKTMVTNGPFKLQQWDENSIHLIKNPNYYTAQEIRFSEVHLLRPKAGTPSPTMAYLNNEVDWVGAKDELIDKASLNSVFPQELYALPYASTYYYQFNLSKAPFKNLKIRKALAMAANRESIGYGTPAYGFIPRSIRGSKLNFRSEIIDTRYFKEDVIQAKKLLQEGLKEEGLTQLPSFSIIINEGHEEIAEAVINSWNKNLGITVGFEVQPWEDLLDNRLKLNYTMAKAAWAADYNDPSTFLDYFTSWSSDNDSGWSSALYDSYIKQARLTLDTSERNKLYAKAEKMLIDQMVILPLYYFYADVLHKPNIKKVSVEYDGSISFSRGYLI
ncbi:hypothetical protein BSK59_26895 [Paenibacillus odorifer]|uniref:peptide ABC transporter substrate-binding protein n=1 Tax=Paenibacillus TaxID=44249 RepID=UPI00096D6445|nr:peptide ABC transporter substrate-binding protein [Paenibacillus odorifer]OME48026.1 hypothetical protein BSK59_26895 [Paenibacillus odorifer]